MSRAESEATAWLDKMMGPDADQHRAAFDEWLAKPGNAKAYDEARDNWTWAGDMSTARIAWFSSDRTILEYARTIWNTPPAQPA